MITVITECSLTSVMKLKYLLFGLQNGRHIIISWNNVVKLPICLSHCPSVWTSVKLNYVSGHRADCAKATGSSTHIHTHTHTDSLFADRRAWRVGNEKRSSCMKAHVSRPASQTCACAHTHTSVIQL